LAVAVKVEPGIGWPVAGSSSSRYGCAAVLLPLTSTTPVNSPATKSRLSYSAKALTAWA